MTDNTCVPQQACGPGTYYKGHTNKPRECLACPANTYQNRGAHRDSACKPHTTCGPGTRLRSASVIIGPGTCQQCPAGEFRSDASHYESECTLHKKCVEGQNRKDNGTATADTRCAQNKECAPVEYEAVPPTAGESDRVCEALATCEAGRYIETPHTNTTDRVCGYCDGETFYTDAPNLLECKEFSFCSFGEFVATAGNAASDLVCGACNSTYDEYQGLVNGSANHRATACRIKQRCPSGTFVARDDNTRGRQCKACPTGRHMTEADHVLDKCSKHANCPAGEQLANASRTTAGSCEACTPGQFRPTTAEPTCRPQTPCQRDTFASSPPGGSSDRVCSPCPTGTSLALDNHTEAACIAPTTTTTTTTAANSSTNATVNGTGAGAGGGTSSADTRGGPATATAAGASVAGAASATGGAGAGAGASGSSGDEGGDGADGAIAGSGGNGCNGGNGGAVVGAVVAVSVVVLALVAGLAYRRHKGLAGGGGGVQRQGTTKNALYQASTIPMHENTLTHENTLYEGLGTADGTLKRTAQMHGQPYAEEAGAADGVDGGGSSDQGVVYTADCEGSGASGGGAHPIGEVETYTQVDRDPAAGAGRETGEASIMCGPSTVDYATLDHANNAGVGDAGTGAGTAAGDGYEIATEPYRRLTPGGSMVTYAEPAAVVRTAQQRKRFK